MKKGLGIVLFFCWINAIYAAPLMHIGIQPSSLIASFGANNKFYTLQFYIVNDSSQAQQLQAFSITPAEKSAKHTIGPVTFKTDCAHGILPPAPGGVCSIFATFPVIGNSYKDQKLLAPETYQFQLKYGTPPRLTTFPVPAATFTINYATGKINTAASRTFNFVNNCSYPVTLGIAAGATNSINPNVPLDLQSCVSNENCYPGQECLAVTPSLNHCFWKKTLSPKINNIL